MVKKYTVGYWDHWDIYDRAGPSSMTVMEQEKENWTGLVTDKGNPIFINPERIGFNLCKKHHS